MEQVGSSPALDRAMQLLWELYWEPSGMSASQLAQKLGIQRSAVYRLLGPLARNQFIRKDSRKRYYLGFGVTALSRAVAEPIENIVRAPLQYLATTSGSSAALIADADGALVTVASAQPARPGMHVFIPPGLVHDVESAAGPAVSNMRRGRKDSADAVELDPVVFSPSRESAMTVAVPIRMPMLGSDACVMLASLSPIDPDVAERELHAIARHLSNAD